MFLLLAYLIAKKKNVYKVLLPHRKNCGIVDCSTLISVNVIFWRKKYYRILKSVSVNSWDIDERFNPTTRIP